jgi:hypothetical protein
VTSAKTQIIEALEALVATSSGAEPEHSPDSVDRGLNGALLRDLR